MKSKKLILNVMYIAFLNRLVRSYLRLCPLRFGKKQLLKLTKQYILPPPPPDVGSSKSSPYVIAPTKHHFEMALNLANPEHQRIYFYGDHDERKEIAFIKKALRQGDVCWDIGANIGFYSCLFSKLVGQSGRVLAFEPAKASQNLLIKNSEINDLDNLSIYNFAIGEVDGEQEMYFLDENLAEGTASLRYKQGNKAELVKIRSIDNLNADNILGSCPNFIKIDVEGFQMEVLLGASKFLLENSPLIMIELIDVGGVNKSELASYSEVFNKIGYSAYSLTSDGLLPCNPSTVKRGRNFFLAKVDSQMYERIAQYIRAPL